MVLNIFFVLDFTFIFICVIIYTQGGTSMNNLKILKIKVSGYKLLEDGFTLNLLNRSRVYDEDKNDEIIEVLENLYIPTVTVFTGRNSSGKSTVLSLMRFI